MTLSAAKSRKEDVGSTESDTVLLFTENLKDIPHNDTFAPTVIISQLLFQEKTDSDYS